ncbi:hypothetical protein CHELA17_60771 [Chelatococcus asaccharovorans]|nr:hypothetical protein CHELA17_60771 [Chelatococcus asaccharovorans]
MLVCRSARLSCRGRAFPIRGLAVPHVEGQPEPSGPIPAMIGVFMRGAPPREGGELA